MLFMLLPLHQWFLDIKLLIHFVEVKNKSILFSKLENLKEINTSFAGHCIKQNDTMSALVPILTLN